MSAVTSLAAATFDLFIQAVTSGMWQNGRLPSLCDELRAVSIRRGPGTKPLCEVKVWMPLKLKGFGSMGVAYKFAPTSYFNEMQKKLSLPTSAWEWQDEGEAGWPQHSFLMALWKSHRSLWPWLGHYAISKLLGDIIKTFRRRTAPVRDDGLSLSFTCCRQPAVSATEACASAGAPRFALAGLFLFAIQTLFNSNASSWSSRGVLRPRPWSWQRHWRNYCATAFYLLFSCSLV